MSKQPLAPPLDAQAWLALAQPDLGYAVKSQAFAHFVMTPASYVVAEMQLLPAAHAPPAPHAGSFDGFVGSSGGVTPPQFLSGSPAWPIAHSYDGHMPATFDFGSPPSMMLPNKLVTLTLFS